MVKGEGFRLTGREVILEPPISEEKIRQVKVGDVVVINGDIFTGRDQVHHYLMSNDSPVDMNGSVFYHCGPVVLKEGNEWRMMAAGPTTSMREEPYEAEVIRQVRHPRRHGQGRHGRENLGGPEGARRDLPERHRRRSAVLRPLDQKGKGDVSGKSSARRKRSGIWPSSSSSPSAPWTPTGTVCMRRLRRRRARELEKLQAVKG